MYQQQPSVVQLYLTSKAHTPKSRGKRNNNGKETTQTNQQIFGDIEECADGTHWTSYSAQWVNCGAVFTSLKCVPRSYNVHHMNSDALKSNCICSLRPNAWFRALYGEVCSSSNSKQNNRTTVQRKAAEKQQKTNFSFHHASKHLTRVIDKARAARTCSKGREESS
jgi:hypothetical protein